MHLSPRAIESAIRLLDQRGSVENFGDIVETAEASVGKFSSENELGGVGNGVRTRDFRSHSPALYH
jgi:hypothetical protein